MPAEVEGERSGPGPESVSPWRWLEAAHAEALATGGESDAARARIVAGAAVAVAEAMGVRLPPLALLSAWGSPVLADVPVPQASPWLLGAAYERLLGTGRRRAAGAFYTPPEVAGAVVGLALTGTPASGGGDRTVVCDPAVGGGAFLLAAAEALAARGVERVEVVADCLIGADLDPVAVAVAEAALALWCGGVARPRLVVGDALALSPGDWPASPHVVVGNPPFLNQLGRATARDPGAVAALRRRFGAAAAGYADTAALFLLLAAELVRPGGTVALVLPQSFLATRDAGGVRSAVLGDAALEGLWLPSRPVFGAAVRVCVPVLRRGGRRRGPLHHYRGVPPRLVAETATDVRSLAAEPTWSHLVAEGSGVPDCRLQGEGNLGEWCQVAADFRQHFYGVAPFVVDDPRLCLDDRSFPPLITAGLIDPAACRWGRQGTRHHGRAWAAPRVDVAALDAGTDLGPWARSRLVPKVVVATQTRVLEAAVDFAGRWLPSTPVITVTAPGGRIWHAAAALLAPPVTAWALRRWGGAALSADALKLSASQVRTIPSPRSGSDWDKAAAAVCAASEADDETARRQWLLVASAASSRAYGIDDPALCRWWADRLPVRRRR